MHRRDGRGIRLVDRVLLRHGYVCSAVEVGPGDSECFVVRDGNASKRMTSGAPSFARSVRTRDESETPIPDWVRAAAALFRKSEWPSALPFRAASFADRSVKRMFHCNVERRMELEGRSGPSSGLPRVQGGQWSSPAFSSWRCRRQAAQSSSKCGDRRGTTSCRGSHQPFEPCKYQPAGFRLCPRVRRAARMSPMCALSVLPCRCSSRGYSSSGG